MATTINLLPDDDLATGTNSQSDNVGKTSVPLFLVLRCHPFTNTPGERAKPSETIQEFILPFPESAPTALNIAYNEELAKEQGLVMKALYSETGNMVSNLMNLPGRIIKDQFQSLSGVDLGRRPMDVTELSFIKAEKRRYSFNWVFTSISTDQSKGMVEACNKLTSFSLPSTAGFAGAGGSTRMIMPPIWSINVIQKASSGTAINNEGLNKAFLQNPKTCFLTNVSVDRDTSSLMPGGINLRTRNSTGLNPTSFALSLSFTEIDPLLRDDAAGELKSRSELRAGI